MRGRSDYGTCGNRGNCSPISFFEDQNWHSVEVIIAPSGADATAAFTMDGDYGGVGTTADYALPGDTYLGFSGRTGGATNNHCPPRPRAFHRAQRFS